MQKKPRYNRLSFLFAVLLLSSADALAAEYEGIIKKYKKQIEKNSSDLSEVQKQIKDKKEEREKFRKEEEKVRKELNRLERELNAVATEITRIKSKIRKTQKNLAYAEREIKTAQMEKGQVQALLRNELRGLSKKRLTAALFDDPWDEPGRKCAIKFKTSQALMAQSKKTNAENTHREYLRIKNELDSLESQLVKKMTTQESVKNEKSAILATTQGSRIAAEEEIKRLNETSGELKKLIQKLEEKKAETLEMKRQEEIAQKEFSEKKAILPWPVTGKVSSSFGKTKHPELDTYVINNGIKIQAQPNQPVLAVDKGEVVYAQVFRSYGKTVIIDHKGGTYTIYGHMGEVLVDEGVKVVSGQQIGKTGHGEKEQFYFEIRIDGQPQDPMNWLK